MDLSVFLIGLVALTPIYAAIALATFRMSGDRAWWLLALLIIVACFAMTTLPATGQVGCPRLGQAGEAVATWCTLLALLGVPAASGSLVARSAARSPSPMSLRNFVTTAGATLAGLAIGLISAYWVYILFYGPDCWP